MNNGSVLHRDGFLVGDVRSIESSKTSCVFLVLTRFNLQDVPRAIVLMLSDMVYYGGVIRRCGETYSANYTAASSTTP